MRLAPHTNTSWATVRSAPWPKNNEAKMPIVEMDTPGTVAF